jgi:hypothetical protein
VLKAHAPIADQLTAGIGMQATYLDSQIAELVIKTMQAEEIAVLPIHDSFIVRTGYQRWLEVVMEEAFKAVTGGLVSTDADGSRLSRHFGLTKGQFSVEEERFAKDPSEGIVVGSALDFQMLFKETVMKKYLGYWELWRTKSLNS